MFPNQVLARTLLAASILIGLTACDDKPSINLGGPFHIALVRVDGKSSPPLLQDLQAKVQSAASHVPLTNDPKTLVLHVAELHKKNPGMSLIVGDGNTLKIEAEISDPVSGAVLSRFETVSSIDAAINGVVGFVVAAAQDQSQVDYRLNTQAADDIMVHLYGRSAWDKFRRLPAH